MYPICKQIHWERQIFAVSGILTGKLGVVENMTSLNFKNEYK